MKYERGKLLRSAFDAICHGISVLDSDLNILLVNQTVEKWYSHALPVMGRKCYEAYHGKSKCCELINDNYFFPVTTIKIPVFVFL